MLFTILAGRRIATLQATPGRLSGGWLHQTRIRAARRLESNSQVGSWLPRLRIEHATPSQPEQPGPQSPDWYVLLASDEASDITGAIIPVTGGKPML